MYALFLDFFQVQSLLVHAVLLSSSSEHACNLKFENIGKDNYFHGGNVYSGWSPN